MKVPYEQIKPHVSSDFHKPMPVAFEDQIPEVLDHPSEEIPIESEGKLIL